jgi:hypothetical protein
MLLPTCPQTNICYPFLQCSAEKGSQVGATRPGVMRTRNTWRANPIQCSSLAMCAQVSEREGSVPRPARRTRAEQGIRSYRTIPDQHKLGPSVPWPRASYLAVNTNVPSIGTSCHEGINTTRFDGVSFHATVLQLPAVMCATQRQLIPSQRAHYG